MNLTAEDVREILHLLDATGFDELHLETDRFTLTLRRTPDGTWTQQTQVTAPAPLVRPATPNPPGTPDTPATPSPPATPTSPPPEGGPPVSNLTQTAQGLPGLSTGSAALWEVRAPLLGTFYRAPQPGAPPFVEVGSHVEDDTVVGIIETMKLMNSVLAGRRGRVVEICLGNAQFAAEGTVLFRIQPDPDPAPGVP